MNKLKQKDMEENIIIADKDQHIKIGKDATDLMVSGATKLANIVKQTLGVDGKHIFLQHPAVGAPLSTKDGAQVAEWVVFRDKFENIGAEVVKFASRKCALESGDGTTTTTILAEDLIRNGVAAVNSGMKARKVVKGMDMAKEAVVEFLKVKSKSITPESPMVKKVAMVASNYDEELSSMISTAVKDHGKETVINVERSLGGETSITSQDGMTVQTSYVHEIFVNTSNNECVLENVAIIMCDYEISTVKEVGRIFSEIEGGGGAGVLDKASGKKKVGGYLFIAKEVIGEALSSLAKSKGEAGSPIAIARAPYGDDFNILIRDIAIKTGGRVVAENEGASMEQMNVDLYCGWAKKIILGRDNLVIIGGDEVKMDMGKRVASLEDLIKKADAPETKDVYKQRLARLRGSIAKLTVGAENEAALKERTDRADDARLAVRSAMEEGVMPGGGIAWIRAFDDLEKHSDSIEDSDVKRGYDIVLGALWSPIGTLLENSGFDENEVDAMQDQLHIAEDNMGYNALTGEIEDLMKSGVIDPTKVLRCAIENAVTIASQIMKTGGAMYIAGNQPR